MAQTGTVSFFGPTEGIYKANLFVHSDASNDSNLSIPLLAEVITTPDIVIDPQNYILDCKKETPRRKSCL